MKSYLGIPMWRNSFNLDFNKGLRYLIQHNFAYFVGLIYGNVLFLLCYYLETVSYHIWFERVRSEEFIYALIVHVVHS